MKHTLLFLTSILLFSCTPMENEPSRTTEPCIQDIGFSWHTHNRFHSDCGQYGTGSGIIAFIDPTMVMVEGILGQTFAADYTFDGNILTIDSPSPIETLYFQYNPALGGFETTYDICDIILLPT